MPTIRRLFLILLTIIAAFSGAIYALAYMVKPKTAELTITIPNDKLNLRPWGETRAQPTLENPSLENALDSSSDSPIEPSH